MTGMEHKYGYLLYLLFPTHNIYFIFIILIRYGCLIKCNLDNYSLCGFCFVKKSVLCNKNTFIFFVLL